LLQTHADKNPLKRIALGFQPSLLGQSTKLSWVLNQAQKVRFQNFKFSKHQKTIDQKKRAVITRPFGREARIVACKWLIFNNLVHFLSPAAATNNWV
jgi:hypothetical protein